MSFHDVRLPQYIEIFAIGRSEFSTSTAVSMSGREVRNSDSQIAKRRYSLNNCCLSADQFEVFNSFFQARAGQRFSFRLRDHFDYRVEKQIIAIGDGVSSEFQLQKTYEDAVSPYVRIITKPVLDNIEIWLDDEVFEVESIDANSGKVNSSNPLKQGVNICASFIFDVPVRFAADSFQYSFSSDGSIKLDDVELIEVFE